MSRPAAPGQGATRVLYVEQNADGTIGGSHYTLLDLIRRLDRADWAPGVLFYERHALFDAFAAAAPTALIGPPHRPQTSRLPRRLRQGLNLARAGGDALRFAREMRQRRTGLLHLNNSLCVGYDTWAPAARLAGCPRLTHERGFFPPEAIAAARPWARLWDRILCVSDAVRDHYAHHGIPTRRLVTVHDGIDAAALRDGVARPREVIRTELGLERGALLVAMVGNLRRWKGQHVLLRALARLAPRHASLRCLLIGSSGHPGTADAAYARELEQLLRESGLADRVRVTGYRRDVPQLVDAADVVVHASITPDPFPRVILEAMALGRPVVAARSGGAVESVVDGETGWLAEPGDHAALAECLERLLVDSAQRGRFGEAALRHVARFSLERHVERVTQVYAELLAGAGRAAQTPAGA